MYNATIRRYGPDGTLKSVFVAEVCNGALFRSNAVQCTGLEGTTQYDPYVRMNAFAGDTLTIEPGTAGYRKFLQAI